MVRKRTIESSKLSNSNTVKQNQQEKERKSPIRMSDDLVHGLLISFGEGYALHRELESVLRNVQLNSDDSQALEGNGVVLNASPDSLKLVVCIRRLDSHIKTMNEFFDTNKQYTGKLIREMKKIVSKWLTTVNTAWQHARVDEWSFTPSNQ